MRRKSHRSPRISSPAPRRVHRRGFRPAVSRLEDRTLLSTVTWTNPNGGDWNTPSNWSTDAVPGPSDDAVINMSGVTVSVNAPISSLGESLEIDNATLNINTNQAFTLSGLTINNGSLNDPGSLTVTGAIAWNVGTIAGLSTLTSQGTLALGVPNCCGGYEFFSGGTLDNQGAATLNTYAEVGGLFLQNDAVFDNQPGASVTIQGNVTIYSDGTASFLNEGTLTQSASAVGSTGIEPVFTQTGTGSTVVAGGSFALEGGGAITGPMTAAAGTTLSLYGEALSSSSVIASSGAVQLQDCTEAGSYSAIAGTYANNVTFTGPVQAVGNLEVAGTVSFAPAVGGAVTLTTGALTVDVSSTLTGTDSFVADGLFTLIDFATVNIPGVIDAYGGVTVVSATLSGVTLNNYATATWRVNDGNGVGISLTAGATINNLAGATFDVVNGYGGAGIGGDGTGAFNNYGTLNSTTNASVGVAFTNSGAVNIQQGSLSLGNVTNSGTVTVAAGAALGVVGYTQTAGATVLNGGTVSGGTLSIDGGVLSGSGTINANVTNAGQVIPGGTGAAGLLTINGNYTQSASGTLDVDLGGTSADSQYDQLAVSGTVTLGGQLDVSLINSFQPALGNSFQILTFGTSSGNFATDNGLNLGGGLFLDLVFNANSLTLDTDQVAISGAPAFPLEGVPITLTGSVTGPSAGNPFTFSWAVTQNGSPFSSGTGSTFSFTPTANATYLVSLTVADTSGGNGTAAVEVIVAPFVVVLDPSAGGALSLSGNATINIPGEVVVDSSSSSALSASGNAQVKASVIDVHGGVQKSGNASFSPAPTTGAATLPDPLASLAEPSTSGLTNYGSKSLSGNSSATICPGIYSQITVSGNGTLTMNSGLYVIEGGGFSVSGNASVIGSGVTIFNAGSKYPSTGGTYGSITLSGNGSYNLTPPTSGTYAGIVIFQTRDNSKALTLGGNASGMTGTVYAPAAQLAESGNAALNAALIVDTLTFSGNAINNTLSLSAPTGTVAYAPNQIRDAYGINGLALDGTGQTIAIVDAYDDPSIFQALDAFDAQFTLTDSGPTLYAQYGPASSFLTVLNQYGQATSLPSTDPNEPGTDNWEVEEALDVEWTHGIAPGAQIILVEANSQSLSDLMASVATAASQPGVSVVSMSWGFPEGQAVFAADEATYDSVFNVPGVTFVASTGDYGAADPEYPAFSPNVVAVGGTSLTLNADNSYNSETGWGYYSDAVGAFIGSGGGISLYEPEPAYQQGVQSTGGRTTPDVSLVADPATGAWIADPYNLDPSNPFEIVGGTSLSAPAWAGLLALVNQGRAAAGESTLNSSTPTDTQQALYMLPQSDYNVVSSGNDGYAAGAGYNLVTGLGTPVANLLVPDLVAYQGPGTSYSGSTVGPLQDAGLVNTGASASGPIDVFSVFDALTAKSDDIAYTRDPGPGSEPDSPINIGQAPGVASRSVPAHDLKILGRPDGTDPQAAASPLSSGLMALDAALLDWSGRSHIATSANKVASSAGPNVSAGSRGGSLVVLGGPRITVLHAKLVDATLNSLDWGRFFERSPE